MADASSPTDLSEAISRLGTARPTRRPFPTVGDTAAAFDRLAERRATEPTTRGHPWIPGDLAHLGEEWWQAHIRWYVVVDDLDGDVTVLTVSYWPALDARHRLTFSPGTEHELNVSTTWLRELLDRCRTEVTGDGGLGTSIRGTGRQMRSRPVRVGDAYAFTGEALRALRDRRDDWSAPGLIVFDVTAPARQEAKIAFYAAAAGSLDPTQGADRDMAELTWQERERTAGGEPEQYA